MGGAHDPVADDGRLDTGHRTRDLTGATPRAPAAGSAYVRTPSALTELMQVDPAHTAPLSGDPQVTLRPADSSRRPGGTVRAKSGTPVRTAAVAPTRRATSDQSGPTAVEVAEEGLFFVDIIVIGATIMPGFLLCVPGLLFVIVPAVVIGIVAAAAGLVVLLAVAPLRVGWRIARRLRHGLAGRRARRSLTVPRHPQPASPRANSLPANATMIASPQALAQQITAHPTTPSSSGAEPTL